MKYWGLVIFCISIWSCKKENISNENILDLSINNNINLQKIHFVNSQEGYIAGGITFDKSIILKTLDGGTTWHEETIINNQNKIIYNVKDYFGKIYAMGLDGKTYIKYPHDSEYFHINQNIYWERMYDFHFFNKNLGVVVSGQNWYFGRFYTIDSVGNILTRDTFEFELNALINIPNQHLLVSGYGAIMYSIDTGKSWHHTNASGDHFIKMHYKDPYVWAIGKYGTIVKSSDYGKTWNKIRNGSNPIYGREIYNALYFKNEKEGMIVGNNGLIKYTTDGGKRWKTLKKITNQNLNDIYLYDHYVLIIGDQGTILRIKTAF
jgi:photosystem II stability/assembly factor-like uncharacterized protein